MKTYCSLGILIIVLLISSWIHYSHAIKLQEKLHRRKQVSDTVASYSSAGGNVNLAGCIIGDSVYAGVIQGDSPLKCHCFVYSSN